MLVLDIRDLSIVFGGLKAVSGVNISLEQGELAGLIGPNGAGKTTVFNMLTGVYSPTSGSIDFCGKSLLRLKPHEITRCGVARTFQNIRLFGSLSVLDNVKIACKVQVKSGLASAIFSTNRRLREEVEIEKRSLALLDVFGLTALAHETARNLPYGAQRRLEIARALATEPKLLLLDEPAAGMNPHETAQLAELIRWIRKEYSLTILLIEHDMDCVMKVCEKIFVLEYGVLIASGSPAEIQRNESVIAAYLGTEVAPHA